MFVLKNVFKKSNRGHFNKQGNDAVSYVYAENSFVSFKNIENFLFVFFQSLSA